ncbi:MAG: hypothetical protein LBE38_07995 [Deltaproteobacteria bacterium]|nr:hypothetical protein [Deltaproteobacteria bacterium]
MFEQESLKDKVSDQGCYSYDPYQNYEACFGFEEFKQRGTKDRGGECRQ